MENNGLERKARRLGTDGRSGGTDWMDGNTDPWIFALTEEFKRHFRDVSERTYADLNKRMGGGRWAADLMKEAVELGILGKSGSGKNTRYFFIANDGLAQ